MHLYRCRHRFEEFFNVNNLGIIKEIDDLGRLQIPKDIRTRLGLKKNVQLVVTPDGLLIKSEEYKLVKLNDKP